MHRPILLEMGPLHLSSFPIGHRCNTRRSLAAVTASVTVPARLFSALSSSFRSIMPSGAQTDDISTSFSAFSVSSIAFRYLRVLEKSPFYLIS